MNIQNDRICCDREEEKYTKLSQKSRANILIYETTKIEFRC